MQALNSALFPPRRAPTIASDRIAAGKGRIVRLVLLALAFAAALPLHASALGKVERCEGLAAIHRAALDLFDAGVPRDDAIRTLTEANAAADPYIVENVNPVTSTAYTRGAAERGEKAERTFVEICLSF
jgi:hypothetical protein